MAKQVVEDIGGKDNIQSLTHCVTRLRFKLKDRSLADKEAVSRIKGVINVVEQGGQFQVVIGNEVTKAYDAVVELTGIQGQAIDVVEKDDLKVKGKFLDIVIDLVTSIFTPIMPALIGGGMIRALLMILLQVGVLQETSGAYIVINEIYVAIFSFLPVYLAFCAANRFKCNEMLAVALALTMVSPTIVATVKDGTAANFLGLPLTVPAGGYGGGVFPIIISVWFLSVVERFCNKHIHPMARNFLTPMIELVITVPIMFLVFGPLVSVLESAVGDGYLALQHASPLLTGILLGGLWQVLVVFGLHWGIVPIGQINLAQYGRNTIGAIIGPSKWAQGGSALGVALRSKDPDIKQNAFSAGLTCIFAISEPAVYGVNLKYKTPFYIALVMSALAGGICGLGNAAQVGGGPVGIFSFPLFLGEGFFVFCLCYDFCPAGILYRDLLLWL